MILDPKNVGIKTMFVMMYALLAELLRQLCFLVMAALICIKVIHGTFWQFFNIANLFYIFFSV